MLAAALFYGSVWGLGEATLGHLLHLTRVPGLPGPEKIKGFPRF